MCVVAVVLFLMGFIQAGQSTTPEEWREAVKAAIKRNFHGYDSQDYTNALTTFTHDAHMMSPGEPTLAGTDAIAREPFQPDVRLFAAERYEIVDFLSCEDWALAEIKFTDRSSQSNGKVIGVLKMVNGSAKFHKFIWNWG